MGSIMEVSKSLGYIGDGKNYLFISTTVLIVLKAEDPDDKNTYKIYLPKRQIGLLGWVGGKLGHLERN